MQYPTRTGPTTNDQATFTPSMTQGSMPDRNRQRLGPQLPACQSQTTHVAASSTPPMHQLVPTVVARPIKPYTAGMIAIAPDVSVFSVEMAQGYAPASPRLWMMPKVGWSVSQPTHTAAAFSVEMVVGARPEFDRQFKAFTSGTSISPPEVLVFSVEMAQGSAPSLPRLFLGPRIDLPLSQPTHVSAPLSVEMSAGNVPTSSRPSKPFTVGGAVLPPDVLAFTIEMVQGSTPSQPRLFVGQRIPLPLSQPTHVQAAFTVDMIQGARPTSGRRSKPFGAGIPSVPPDVSPFSVEMVQGWHPDSPRLFKGPKLGQQLAQTTHVVARFSQEMVAGYQARKGQWITHKDILGALSEAVNQFSVAQLDAAAIIQVGTDRWVVFVDDEPRILLIAPGGRQLSVGADPHVADVNPDPHIVHPDEDDD